MAAAAVSLLYFFQLGGMGLVGPDEPRYAWIGRAMAESGDWVTPRLWGEPWFEKPPLLYWMTAAGFRLGLGDEWAPRLPVALLSAGFLVFFWRRLSREFGEEAAWYATAVLATSAGWVAFSHATVVDIPLAATFGAAMLLLMAGRPAGFGALLGASMLAKGLVGPVLAGLTLAATGWRAVREAARPAAAARFLAAFTAVAGPWYVWCWARNGSAFVEEFFWRHHVARFSAGALEHNQPFWFFVPVLAAGLLPWTPVCAALRTGGDRRCRFLLAWAAVTVVFFSLSRDKLPGYVLPALPPLAALAGVALARQRPPMRLTLALSALPLALFPVAAAVLPEALNTGLDQAMAAARISPAALAGVAALAAGIWWAENRGRRALSVAALTVASAAGYAWMKHTTFPAIDQAAGARALWRQVEPHRDEVCLGEVRRLEYGLNYYAGHRLPACRERPQRYRIEESGVVVSLEP